MFNSDCYAVIADLNKYRVHVTNTKQTLQTVSSQAIKHGAKVAVNIDAWTQYNLPLSIAASDGIVYQRNQLDYRPFINFLKSGKADIRSNGVSDLYNTGSGVRYIVENNTKPLYLFGSEIQYTERHPRTACGLTVDGKLILLVVDGRSESQGVTLSELAGIMIDLGAVDAIDFDGGGSSAMWYGDKIVNVPSDGAERPVVNHLLLIEGNTPMAITYEITMVLNQKIVSAPNANGVQTGQVSAGAKWTSPSASGDYFQHPSGWVCTYKAGDVALTYKVISTDPPPVEPPPTGPTLTHTISVYNDGSIKVDGNAYP
jgi:hypothetical protein